MNSKHPAPLDYRGTVLIYGRDGARGARPAAVERLGLGQAPPTWICIAAGAALLAAFVVYELRRRQPAACGCGSLRNRAFAVDNAVLFLLMIPFIPLFFFASMYAQISLGESASETGLYLLIFFAGFAIATQWGGRILDRVGARPRWSPAARSPRSASTSGATS